MPLVTNFSSASLTYSLNAPAVGASLPLSVDSTALNIVDSAPLSYRNRIINGAMQISQRYGATEYLAANGYSVDRFSTRYFSAPTGVIKAQQVTDAPTGFNYSVKVTCTTAQAGLNTTSGTNGFGIVQLIEGFNVGDFDLGTAQAKTFTLSFWVKSSQTGVFSVCFTNSTQDRAYGAAVTINSANTWEYKTITVAGDTSMSGTWLKDNGMGLGVFFGLGANTGRIVTQDVWGSGVGGNLSPLRVSGQTINIVETVGASFQVTGVQLEVGSKASAFERRPYGLEEQLCKRYCHVTRGGLQSAGVPVAGTSWVMTVMDIFPVQMRAVPVETGSGSITVDLAGVTGNSVGSGTLGISIWGPSSARIECISGVSAAYFRSPSRQRIYSAEL
jgi:hypothetical protein